MVNVIVITAQRPSSPFPPRRVPPMPQYDVKVIAGRTYTFVREGPMTAPGADDANSRSIW